METPCRAKLTFVRDRQSEVGTTPFEARPLTPREHEVVALTREGASTRDIGRRLRIPTRAVAALLDDARNKLAANEGLGRRAAESTGTAAVSDPGDYRVCATDAAGNHACSDVTSVP